jgi:hypothetical protein
VSEEASSGVWRLDRLAFMQSAPPRSVGRIVDRQARADPQSIAENATCPIAACEQRACTQSQIHRRPQVQGPRPSASANPSSSGGGVPARRREASRRTSTRSIYPITESDAWLTADAVAQALARAGVNLVVMVASREERREASRRIACYASLQMRGAHL